MESGNSEMDHCVLKIDKSGHPVNWMSKEEAATLLCNNKVIWAFGDRVIELRGGINRLGERSILKLHPILAVSGRISNHSYRVPLSNRLLARRDRYICMYCGQKFPLSRLTRDHILPKSRGGRDAYENLVVACQSCNSRKGNRTPEEAGMPLLAVPFQPTFCEFLALANHHVLADQMAYLEKGFKHQHMRLN